MELQCEVHRWYDVLIHVERPGSGHCRLHHRSRRERLAGYHLWSVAYGCHRRSINYFHAEIGSEPSQSQRHLKHRCELAGSYQQGYCGHSDHSLTDTHRGRNCPAQLLQRDIQPALCCSDHRDEHLDPLPEPRAIWQSHCCHRTAADQRAQLPDESLHEGPQCLG